MHFVGIDPGAQGALCILDSSNRHPLFVDLDKKHKADDIINSVGYELENSDGVHVNLEEVHSLGGMSARSNFTFGGMFWRAVTILEAMSLHFVLVQPKVWQQAVGVPAKKNRPADVELKRLVANLAINLYPSANIYGPRGGLKDGRSDALMIAHYGLITHGGDYGIQANPAGTPEVISKT